MCTGNTGPYGYGKVPASDDGHGGRMGPPHFHCTGIISLTVSGHGSPIRLGTERNMEAHCAGLSKDTL